MTLPKHEQRARMWSCACHMENGRVVRGFKNFLTAQDRCDGICSITNIKDLEIGN